MSVSAPSAAFEIAVGDNGQIVHFVDGDSGTVMPSGTSKNLLDVHAVDPSFAVASGQDVRLIWDGASWTPIYPESNGDPRFFTPIWAPPEKDRVLYQELNTGFGFHTLCQLDPEDPDAAESCLTFNSPILAFCGESDDIKALRTNGTIERFTGGTLTNQDDPGNPVFEQPGATPLDLIAAFIAPGDCVSGNFPPLEILAIHRGSFNNEFWRFDGSSWSKQADAGAGQTLTGMDGLVGADVVAVGRKSSVTEGIGNEGVVWAYDGENWSEEELPEGTAGLADVSYVVTYKDEIYMDGFEPQPASTAAAEAVSTRPAKFTARGENADSTRGLVPHVLSAELKLTKILVSPDPLPDPGFPNSGSLVPPVEVDQIVTFRLILEHKGGDWLATGSVTIRDKFYSLEFVDSPNCENVVEVSDRELQVQVLNFEPGDVLICDLRMRVLASAVKIRGENTSFTADNFARPIGYFDLVDGSLSRRCSIFGIDTDKGTNVGCE